MRRLITIALTLIGALMLVLSCEKAPFVTMNDPRSFTFTRDGGTQSFTFTCNRDWSVSPSESWIRVSPSSGSKSNNEVEVTIMCMPNTMYDPRNATITVRVEELTEIISVTQETGLGLLVSPTTFDLTNAAQDIEIEVQKNVQYSVAIDDTGTEWIRQGGTKALSTDKVTFHISANTSYDNREGNITFKQLDGELSAKIVVKQKQTDNIIISKSNYDLSNEEHTLTVDVQSNVAFEVISQVDWVKHVETKALSASAVTLSVNENETYKKRTGTVLIKQKDGDLSRSITCVQKGCAPLEHISLNYTYKGILVGDDVQLIVVPHPSNVQKFTPEWSSSNDNVATVDAGLVKAISKGEATITAKVENYTATCLIVVGTEADCYIDEYGVNRGLGTKINGITWAPVNCGYSPDQYPYGKLYQWGRKDGQGYATSLQMNDEEDYSKGGIATDEAGKEIKLVQGPISYAPDPNTFYYGSSSSWTLNITTDMWNLGTEDNPIKNEVTDPCPQGWRVPTKAEAKTLVGRSVNSSQTGDHGETEDLSGLYLPKTEGIHIFLPYTGYWYMGSTDKPRCGGRNEKAAYHISTCSPYALQYGHQWSITITNNSANVNFGFYGNTICGNPVRCVRE